MKRVFFQDKVAYPLGASAEPLAEWNMQEVLGYEQSICHQEGTLLPSNDVYGKMFFYVRDFCVTFQFRIRNMDVEMSLFSMPLCNLPMELTKPVYFPDPYFDRIEVLPPWCSFYKLRFC